MGEACYSNTQKAAIWVQPCSRVSYRILSVTKPLMPRNACVLCSPYTTAASSGGLPRDLPAGSSYQGQSPAHATHQQQQQQQRAGSVLRLGGGRDGGTGAGHLPVELVAVLDEPPELEALVSGVEAALPTGGCGGAGMEVWSTGVEAALPMGGCGGCRAQVWSTGV